MIVLTWSWPSVAPFWPKLDLNLELSCSSEFVKTNQCFLRRVPNINYALPSSTASGLVMQFNTLMRTQPWWGVLWPTSTTLQQDNEQWAAITNALHALRFIEQSSQYETNFTIYCCLQIHRGILCNCDHQKAWQTHTKSRKTQMY